VQLAIDSASDNPGIALAIGGIAALTLTWETQQNHSVELLPNIERLLAEADRQKADLEAVIADIGPGGYAALRVGVSTAKALAHAFGVPLAGVGRLEIDAYGVAGDARDRRIIAVHRSGRGEVAWAAYRLDGDGTWSELVRPHVTGAEAMHDALREADVLTGDVDDTLAEAAQRAGSAVLVAERHRVVSLAALGQRRFASGTTDDPIALVPLYLRAPAIGPQSSGSQSSGPRG
jgi:tRNA threonylcarbamoyladenosine biosynthesis protein TsaB